MSPLVPAPPSTHRPVLLAARALSFAPGGGVLFDRLSFDIVPGLTLVRGGDGRGKTTLLRLMAGTLEPDSGVLQRPSGPPHAPDAGGAADDDAPARDWLARERAAHDDWDVALEADLVEGFALAGHLDKALFRLSTGSRRKLALVSAFAARAPLVLLDLPFAALDGPSRALLALLLTEAAGHRSRGWVIADHALAPSLADVALAGTVELGD